MQQLQILNKPDSTFRPSGALNGKTRLSGLVFLSFNRDHSLWILTFLGLISYFVS